MKILTTLAAASALAMTSCMAMAGGLASPAVEDDVSEPVIVEDRGLSTGSAIALGVLALAAAAAILNDSDSDH